MSLKKRVGARLIDDNFQQLIDLFFFHTKDETRMTLLLFDECLLCNDRRKVSQ